MSYFRLLSPAYLDAANVSKYDRLPLTGLGIYKTFLEVTYYAEKGVKNNVSVERKRYVIE